MKSNLKSFLKFGLVTQLPIYGLILWIFLSCTNMWYWYCWILANIIYWITMFPIYKKGIFDLK